MLETKPRALFLLVFFQPSRPALLQQLCQQNWQWCGFCLLQGPVVNDFLGLHRVHPARALGELPVVGSTFHVLCSFRVSNTSMFIDWLIVCARLPWHAVTIWAAMARDDSLFPPHGFQDGTQNVRLGDRHLQPLIHLVGPTTLLKCQYFVCKSLGVKFLGWFLFSDLYGIKIKKGSLCKQRHVVLPVWYKY